MASESEDEARGVRASLLWAFGERRYKHHTRDRDDLRDSVAVCLSFNSSNAAFVLDCASLGRALFEERRVY